MKRSLLLVLWMTCLSLPTLMAQLRQLDSVSCKMGFWDKGGKVLLQPEYDYLPYDYDTLMMARKGKGYGIIRGNGQVVLPFEYAQIMRLPNGWFRVTKDHRLQPKWGLLDNNGIEILPLQYEEIGLVDTRWIWVRTTNRTVQVFDKGGKLLFTSAPSDGPTQVQPGYNTQSVFIRRQSATPSSWSDLQGQPLDPKGLEGTIWSNGQHFIVKRDRRYGLVDAAGSILLPVRYYSIEPLPNGHFAVEDSTWQKGMMTASGNWLMKEKRKIVSLGDGPQDYYTPTVPNNNLGVFDATGKQWYKGCQSWPVISPLWDYLPECNYQRYSWLEEGRSQLYGLMRADGKLILPVEYKKIAYASDGHPLLAYRREEGTNWRAMAYDFYGRALLPSSFLVLEHTESPCLLFGKKTADGRWGFIPLSSPEQAEMIYDSIKVIPNKRIDAYKGKEVIRFSLSGQSYPKELLSGVGSGAPSTADPSFPGGESALMNYIARHLRYPEEARKQGIEGTVVLGFMVESDGRLSDIRLRRDIGGGCGEEAVRLVTGMPKWTPGKNAQGKPIQTKMTLPVKFKLN
jgi:TonB family protein